MLVCGKGMKYGWSSSTSLAEDGWYADMLANIRLDTVLTKGSRWLH